MLMKHFTQKLLVVAVAMMCCATAVKAQMRVVSNTVSPQDFKAYNGQTVDVTLFRYVLKGWNTICLPFSMTEQEINDAFGDDCRLETLVGVENSGAATKLNFKDVKPDGIQANTPYILYSEKENGVRTIRIHNALISTEDVVKTFSDNTGTEVSFSGATEQQGTSGMYGIIAKDNANAAFVDASKVDKIYASRCFIKVNNGDMTRLLTSNHLDYNVTGIEDLKSAAVSDEQVDVYNISGVKVATAIAPADIQKLGKGVYVVKGRKILVK